MSRSIWFAAAIIVITAPAEAGDAQGFAPRGLAGESRLSSGTFGPVTRYDEADLARFFGSAVREWGNSRFSVPLRHEQWQLDAQRSLLVNALAIQWEHSLESGSLMSLSARYGDGVLSDTERRALSGTAAVFSWSSLFGNDTRLIGRVFVGDEEARDRSIRYAARRYVGLEIEGRYSLWRDHAPFAGLAWQRNDYQALDSNGVPSYSMWRSESVSRLAAGWAWQIQPHWDLRAEANYRMADETLDAVEGDRTQFYFTTRYGFR
jgi:hypothetical protein